MKKETNTPSGRAHRLITAGVIMLLSTPFVQPLYLAIAQSGCPWSGTQRECGLELGLQIGFIATALPFLWLGIGAIVLINGLILRSNSKNNP